MEPVPRAHRFNDDFGRPVQIYKIVQDVLFLVCKIAPKKNFAALINGGDK